MKNHVFTYNKLNDGVDFFGTNFYTDKQIEAIPDPEGGKTKKLPTSIPSPFAIIDLVATAFGKLANSHMLKGYEVYEKIVSQCLDVGLLFFNAPALKDKIEIIHWNRKEQLAELINSQAEGHRILGNTLNMYLKDDAQAYNFNDCEDIYLITYNYNIVGGTSPKTLFFCTLNPIEDDPENHINLGDNNKLFDKQYCPLYDRPEEFQLYLYKFVKYFNIQATNEGKQVFSISCKEFNDYLEKNKAILKTRNKALFAEIENINGEDFTKSFNSVEAGKAGSYVKVLGMAIGSKAPKTEGQSDFMIASKKFKGKLPLALFPGFGGQNLFGQTMNYFDQNYTKEIDQEIPYNSRESDLNNRELPGMTGIYYPHLLVDDLLEDTLFRKIYPTNENKFFNCNFEDDGPYSYLCPVKKEFFKYFDTNDLISGSMNDGKPFFELETRAGDSIQAILRLPVNKGYITFTKTYLQNNRTDEVNVGNVKDLNFDVNIFPFIDYDPNQDVNALPTETNEFRTNFIYNSITDYPKVEFNKNNGEPLNVREAKEKGEKNNFSYKIYVTDHYYDFISIKYENSSCIIIPLWTKWIPPSKVFHFAIDFGTTNTHIEYRVDKQEATPLNLTSATFGRLSTEYILQDLANKEFIPDEIKNGSNFCFYQRSAISATKSLNYDNPVLPLADLRIPFYYESEDHTSTSDYFTNLKWSNYVNSEEEEIRVKAFLEQLVLMMKAKVLIGEGKIKETKFTWFYPSSMLRARISKLEKLWLNLLQKHFYVNENNINKISESIAPYAFYSERERIDSNLKPAITVDIGGGTTDIVVFKEDKPIYLSSFRYAANSIFGDGYNSQPENNGFYNKYYDLIQGKLNSNKLTNILDALESIKNSTSNSADIVAFFMSLENNTNIADKHNISFQKMLSDDGELKIVILLFYHSLVYHIASLLKLNNLNIPSTLVFSGNGGKLVMLLDESINFELISEYTSLIFNFVYGQEGQINQVKIKLKGDPKSVTCKGGLYIKDDMNVDHSKITKVLLGADKIIDKLPTYPELKSSESIKNSVVKEVDKCIELFFDLNKKFNYNNNFSINAGTLNVAKNYLQTEGKVEQWLVQGINRKIDELKDNLDVEIEETLFFYPYVGLLNELADIIVRQ